MRRLYSRFFKANTNVSAFCVFLNIEPLSLFKAIPHNVIKRESQTILMKKKESFYSNSEACCKKRRHVYSQNRQLIASYVIPRCCLKFAASCCIHRPHGHSRKGNYFFLSRVFTKYTTIKMLAINAKGLAA